MKFSPLVVIGCLLAQTIAAPAPAPVPHIVHEKRDVESIKWKRSDVKLRRDTIIPVSIGLTQRNLDNGYDFLMDVSDPHSANYGKHWPMEKIAETFRPSDETVAAVRAWLAENGIGSDRARLSKGMNWFKFDATIEETETLLHTEYKMYIHVETGKPHLACDEYSVPVKLRDHIDFITPTVAFDAIVKDRPRKRYLERRDEIAGKPISGAVRGEEIPIPELANFSNAASALANCDKFITPQCLRALYEVPEGTIQKSSYGIVEYTPNTYKQSDLDSFYALLTPGIPAGTGPDVKLIDGGVAQISSSNSFDESDLDLEYAIALVYPQKVTLYQVGDPIESASFNNFLDAIDGSYCASGGGDNPAFDSTYPDPAPGGFKSKDCGTVAPAAVISTSYSYDEAQFPASYLQRQCNEYMKLGLAGVTILYSSGDNGVAGGSNSNPVCCVNPGCAGGLRDPSGLTFNPTFPSTCPYVTSVGATQIKPGASVTEPEVACETVIHSSGGFSNVFALPSYQKDAIGTYYRYHKPPYGSHVYNNNQNARGYPDVSANGANYVVVVGGNAIPLFGTSASSPTFGSIITLINEKRAQASKGPVGFINPVMYQHPHMFNDIESGKNPGCGTNGFSAVDGWDPVTGLGTPDYGKMLHIMEDLP